MCGHTHTHTHTQKKKKKKKNILVFSAIHYHRDVRKHSTISSGVMHRTNSDATIDQVDRGDKGRWSLRVSVCVQYKYLCVSVFICVCVLVHVCCACVFVHVCCAYVFVHMPV